MPQQLIASLARARSRWSQVAADTHPRHQPLRMPRHSTTCCDGRKQQLVGCFSRHLVMVNTAVFAFKPSSTTFHCSRLRSRSAAQPPQAAAQAAASDLLQGGVLLARTECSGRNSTNKSMHASRTMASLESDYHKETPTYLGHACRLAPHPRQAALGHAQHTANTHECTNNESVVPMGAWSFTMAARNSRCSGCCRKPSCSTGCTSTAACCFARGTNAQRQQRHVQPASPDTHGTTHPLVPTACT